MPVIAAKNTTEDTATTANAAANGNIVAVNKTNGTTAAVIDTANRARYVAKIIIGGNAAANMGGNICKIPDSIAKPKAIISVIPATPVITAKNATAAAARATNTAVSGAIAPANIPAGINAAIIAPARGRRAPDNANELVAISNILAPIEAKHTARIIEKPAISPSITVISVKETAITNNAAAHTNKPVPSKRTAAPASSAPAAKTISPAPSMIIAAAPAKPFAAS